MQSTSYCHKCGRGVPRDAAFCPNCGSRITYVSRWSSWDWNSRRYGRRGDRPDWWGLVTAFGFLVILGLVLAAYPDFFARIVSYFESFGVYGHPVLPPYNLGRILIYLFNLSAIWGLIAAALRFVIASSGSRAARDGVGALFSFYTAGILTQFYAGAYGGWGLIGMWIVGLAFVIVADSLITFFVPRRIPLYAA